MTKKAKCPKCKKEKEVFVFGVFKRDKQSGFYVKCNTCNTEFEI